VFLPVDHFGTSQDTSVGRKYLLQDCDHSNWIGSRLKSNYPDTYSIDFPILKQAHEHIVAHNNPTIGYKAGTNSVLTNYVHLPVADLSPDSNIVRPEMRPGQRVDQYLPFAQDWRPDD